MSSRKSFPSIKISKHLNPSEAPILTPSSTRNKQRHTLSTLNEISNIENAENDCNFVLCSNSNKSSFTFGNKSDRLNESS